MMNEIADITPEERIELAKIRYRPGAYLGSPSITALSHFLNGFSYAMYKTDQTEEHNILPEGLHQFAAKELLGNDNSSAGWWGIILHTNGRDEEKSFYAFFELLDKYLASLGYEPIPKWEDISDT